MSDPIALFHHVLLGDFKNSHESVSLTVNEPQVQTSRYAAKAHVAGSGAAAYYDVVVVAAFKRGYYLVETERAFWTRLRQFVIDMVAAMSGPGNQMGPVCMVRDLDGQATGVTDLSAMTVAKTSGTSIVNANIMAGWSVNDYVLLVDHSTDPKISEVVRIETVDIPGDTFVCTTVNSFAINSQVYRVDNHWPQMFLVGRLDLPGDGVAAENYVEKITLTFRGTADPVQGFE